MKNLTPKEANIIVNYYKIYGQWQPTHECVPCGEKVELTPADMYGDNLAICDCGRFYTPILQENK